MHMHSVQKKITQITLGYNKITLIKKKTFEV